jgi:hypothetical protein
LFDRWSVRGLGRPQPVLRRALRQQRLDLVEIAITEAAVPAQAERGVCPKLLTSLDGAVCTGIIFVDGS